MVALVPEAEGDTARAAAGFEKRGIFIGEETFDQSLLRFPKADKVRGAGVVDDGDWIVEVGADGFGGNLLHRRKQREWRRRAQPIR